MLTSALSPTSSLTLTRFYPDPSTHAPFTASACRVPAERTTAQPGSADLFCSLLVFELRHPTACLIVNGRDPHTDSGTLTFEPQQDGSADTAGCSYVGFCLADERLFHSIRSFKIAPHQNLSDHNLILCSLQSPALQSPAVISVPHQRAFFSQTTQHKLAAFLHACFDYWKTHTTPLPS